MGNLIGKIKEKGIRKSIRMVSVKLKKQERRTAGRLSGKRRAAIEAIMGRDFDTVIIFENHFGYYNIMLQRPQHITRQLCDGRTLVLYNSYYDVDYRDSVRITKIKDNCYILDMYDYRHAVLESLRERGIHKFLMTYSTDTVPLSLIRQYEEEKFRVLYEYVDDINPDLIAPKKLAMVMERHDHLIRDKKAFVVATATKLYENVLAENDKANVALISNGAECAKFQAGAKTRDKEYLSWLKEDCIKVGYYGALASWVDYDLLKSLAQDPKIQIILIGIEHDGSLSKSGLLDYENVRYFGKKPYEQLAGYAQFFDVCMIPFVVNEITESASPVKLFEYMAMGKPVVSAPLIECKKYELVRIASGAEEFRKEIYEAAKCKDDESYVRELKNCAAENDWAGKARQVKEFLLGCSC